MTSMTELMLYAVIPCSNAAPVYQVLGIQSLALPLF